MKKKAIGLVVAFAVLAGMVGASACAYPIDAGSSTDNTLNAETAGLNTDVGDTTVTKSSATSLMPADSIAESEDGVGNPGSRGYIDMDRSGDWSEGDIPLASDGDTYYIPASIQQP